MLKGLLLPWDISEVAGWGHWGGAALLSYFSFSKVARVYIQSYAHALIKVAVYCVRYIGRNLDEAVILAVILKVEEITFQQILERSSVKPALQMCACVDPCNSLSFYVSATFVFCLVWPLHWSLKRREENHPENCGINHSTHLFQPTQKHRSRK